MIITAVDAIPFSFHTMQIEDFTVSDNSAIKRAFLPGLLIFLAHYCVAEAQGNGFVQVWGSLHQIDRHGYWAERVFGTSRWLMPS